MRIFLTGGSGMVGKNFLEHPSSKNHEILAPGHRELDLLDSSAVDAWYAKNKPDLVVHSAAKVGGIQANMREPVDFLVVNTEIGKNVIMGARKAGVKNFLNLGSSCMYPRNRDEALKEEDVLSGELEPTNEGYAISKIFAARLCSYIRREDPSFIYATAIPCNLYGRWDSFSPQKSHMIPAAIRKLSDAVKSASPEVEIWGTGNARREFMYSGDLAEFLHRAVLDLSAMPETLNVGLGFDHSVNEYYEAAAKVIGFQGKFKHDVSKPEGMKRKLCDVTRLAAWGFKAPTSLEEGIRKTYEFFLKEGDKA